MGATLHKGLLRVAKISAPTDPAFHPRSPEWLAKVKRYVRTRAPEDLDALPRRGDSKPVLYGIGVLTPGQYEEVSRLKDVAHLHACVRLGVKTIEHADGKVETAPDKPDDAWLARVAEIAGQRGVLELGQVVRVRAEIGDVRAEEIEGDEDPLDRSDLYSLPSGAPLAVQRAPVSAAAAGSSTSSPTTQG